MNKQEIIRKEDTFQLGTYSKMPMVLTKGRGMTVWDNEENEYLDFYGGHAVALPGHCHPKIIEAIKTQSEKLIFFSNVCYSDIRAEASEKLIRIAPAGLSKVFFCNSGTEANETALKIARRFAGKDAVVAMKGGFHGRTIGALSATEIGGYRDAVSPKLSGTVFAEFGDLGDVRSKIDETTAAVILEPIQSMAGVRMAAPDFYKGLRELCDEKGVVLIFDEVQTGFGRSGYMFAGEGWGVTPDIITVAKGMAGGFPMGGVLINETIAGTIKPGEHGSTFGGGMLACAALGANIDIILEEGLVENARAMGDSISEKVKRFGFIDEVRGRGLLLGLKSAEHSVRLKDFLFQHRIITGLSCDKAVLRLMPPLIIKETHVEKFIEVLALFEKEIGK